MTGKNENEKAAALYDEDSNFSPLYIVLATLLRAISRSLDSVESSLSSKNCVRTEGCAVPSFYKPRQEKIIRKKWTRGREAL